MTEKLTGRVALVTGAGRYRGIGRATALRLAEEGAAVVVSAAPRDPATYTADEKVRGWRGAASIVSEIEHFGGRAMAVECDVTSPDQVEELFEQVSKRLGVPDAIVNNAGTAGGAGSVSLLDIENKDWHRAIDINLNGTFNVCKAAGRMLRDSDKPGAIVNIGSLAARIGMANYGGYCASKFAVVGLTQQLAMELAPLSIRVNAVCPGSVDTDMMDGTFHRTANRSTRSDFDRVKGSAIRSIPMRRQSLPSEQAAAIGFLLGPDAGYITGQTVNVDGGIRMD